jgi:hypothetical protein
MNNIRTLRSASDPLALKGGVPGSSAASSQQPAPATQQSAQASSGRRASQGASAHQRESSARSSDVMQRPIVSGGAGSIVVGGPGPVLPSPQPQSISSRHNSEAALPASPEASGFEPTSQDFFREGKRAALSAAGAIPRGYVGAGMAMGAGCAAAAALGAAALATTVVGLGTVVLAPVLVPAGAAAAALSVGAVAVGSAVAVTSLGLSPVEAAYHGGRAAMLGGKGVSKRMQERREEAARRAEASKHPARDKAVPAPEGAASSKSDSAPSSGTSSSAAPSEAAADAAAPVIEARPGAQPAARTDAERPAA